jgi:hypothetical protein
MTGGIRATSSSHVVSSPPFTDGDIFTCGYKRSIDTPISMPIADVSEDPAAQFVVIYSPATEESSQW